MYTCYEVSSLQYKHTLDQEKKRQLPWSSSRISAVLTDTLDEPLSSVNLDGNSSGVARLSW